MTLGLDDAVGQVVDLSFESTPRTLRGTLIVGDDEVALTVRLPSGLVVSVAVDLVEQLTILPPEFGDDPPPSDLAEMLAQVSHCDACGVDGRRRPIRPASALVVSESGLGVGLCSAHLNGHSEALSEQRKVTLLRHREQQPVRLPRRMQPR